MKMCRECKESCEGCKQYTAQRKAIEAVGGRTKERLSRDRCIKDIQHGREDENSGCEGRGWS